MSEISRTQPSTEHIGLRWVAGRQREADHQALRRLQEMSDAEMDALGIETRQDAIEYAADLACKNTLVTDGPSAPSTAPATGATPRTDAVAALLDAVCVGNHGCDLKVRCQSYEASEQSGPCPAGQCVMAHDDDDVRSRHEIIADLVAANKRIFDLERELAFSEECRRTLQGEWERLSRSAPSATRDSGIALTRDEIEHLVAFHVGNGHTAQAEYFRGLLPETQEQGK